VAIPALDEERSIARVIEGIPSDIPGVTSVEILVVDDGSRDQTAQIAESAGATVLRHLRHRGLGSAFRTALSHAVDGGFDIVATIDGDGQFDPLYIPTLLVPILEGRADFTTASRFKDPQLTPEMPWAKRWGNRIVSRLISRLAGQRFYDVSCGMRCYSRRAALHLQLLGQFTYTQEVFLNLAFKDLRIVEIPLPVRGEREFGKSRVASSLSRYAWQTSKIVFRSYRDYRPLRFFGSLALLCALPAAGLGIFLLLHFLQTGHFSPHKWAGVSALSLFGGTLLFATVGVIGDMLNRHRIYLEEILYRLRSDAGQSS
jgi:glycosyltransferase involved in cell wall biosynthesis